MQRDGTRAALSLILPLLLAVLVLTAAGMVSIRAIAVDEGTKQAIFILFGIAAALAVQMVNYRVLLALSPLIYALSLLPVLYTVAGRFAGVPLVRQINGAYAWILLGPISIQPAELTKLGLVLVLAWTLRGENETRSKWVLTRSLMLAGLAMFLILQQPDLGTVLTLIPPTLVMVYVAGVKKRHLLALMAMGMVLAPVLWFSGTCAVRGPSCELCSNVVVLNRLPQFVKHYQRARVRAMYTDDPRVLQDAGFQQQRAMEALGSGGLLGKGMGNVPAGEKVPEAHTDMVLALIGEQFGLLGVGIILMAYALMVGVGAAIASEHRDQTGSLLAVGLITLLSAQAALNMAVALRIMPVTGVTLPLISYGGSSLVVSFLALGLLVNVARNQRRVKF